MSKTLSYILYRGPSQLDGAPIVVIATGFADSSVNIKTGKMIQTWILREDISPLEATHSGQDSSICGNCPARGVLVTQPDGTTRNKLRECYVLEFQAPLQIWRTYKAGKYVDATGYSPERFEALFEGRNVRLGAYGDPAAVPDRVWALATGLARRWAGYTHQWRTATPFLRLILMASADSQSDADEAQAEGWRTFRVGEEVSAGEISCPASKEAGERVKCAACGLCAGAFRVARNIVIKPHGNRVVSAKKQRGKILALAGA